MKLSLLDTSALNVEWAPATESNDVDHVGKEAEFLLCPVSLQAEIPPFKPAAVMSYVKESVF